MVELGVLSVLCPIHIDSPSDCEAEYSEPNNEWDMALPSLLYPALPLMSDCAAARAEPLPLLRQYKWPSLNALINLYHLLLNRIVFFSSKPKITILEFLGGTVPTISPAL